MTTEEALDELNVIYERLSHPEDCEQGVYSFRDGDYLEALDVAIKALVQQPKIGHWILLANELYMCSECYAKWTMRLNYCPTCGAKMKEDAE